MAKRQSGGEPVAEVPRRKSIPVFPIASLRNKYKLPQSFLFTLARHRHSHVLEERFSSQNMLIARRFSVTNFVIATSALGFQVFVLYPWHKQLDDDFKELKDEQLRIMRESQATHIKHLSELQLAIEQIGKKRV